MLELHGVSKTFGDYKAVDDLSFTVEDGEIVGFVGPNGAGKTTTMKMLTGILQPDCGVINVNGFDMKKDPIKAKEVIGYIADSPDMFLRLKGIEFLNFIADIYKVPTDVRRGRIETFATRFDLVKVLDTPMQGY